jgi:hypothetical protein
MRLAATMLIAAIVVDGLSRMPLLILWILARRGAFHEERRQGSDREKRIPLHVDRQEIYFFGNLLGDLTVWGD